MPGPIRPFFAELRRRNVFKVTSVYAATAFVLWQVAEIAFPRLGLPEWSITLVVVLTLVGLPFAVVLAWAYELTPEGITLTTSQGTRDVVESGAGALRPEDEPSNAHRVAVLPLANIHADRDQDYFADGMTEELISVISRIQGLDVIARTSVMAYRDTTKSVSQIGQELAVGTLLEGSVRKAGDQLRITVQLIDVKTQGHLWSHDYDRELSEVFRIQSDIARHVADALEVTLLGPEERRIERAPTQNFEAYDLYLLGRHHVNKRTDGGLRKAIEYFEKAIELDSDFAPPYAGLADVYVLAAIGYAPIPDALDHASESARKAVELDADLAEAHTSLGYVLLNRDWDWKAAEREFGRAIELSPSSAQAYQWYAHAALYRRRYEEAAQRADRARELDPLSVLIQNESGWPAHHGGDNHTALSRFERAASMDPTFAMAHYNIGNIHEFRGDLETAIACYRRAVELSGRMPFTVSFLAAALARTGEQEEARACLNELLAQEKKGAALSVWLAYAYEAMGEKGHALRYLERALDRREPIAVALDTRWLPFASLRDEPRYQEIVRRISECWGWHNSGTPVQRGESNHVAI